MDWDSRKALRYALSRNIQVSPAAFEILKLVPPSSLEKVTKNMVQTNVKERRALITADELEEYLGLKKDEKIESDLKVLSDPTDHITSSEGAEGYGSLFVSRYEKLKQIILARPEGDRLRTVSFVKNAKDSKDAYVAGLVDYKDVGDGKAELRIEDPTGVLTIPVFDEGLQEKVGSLIQDQLVLVQVGWSKRGVFAKDIMHPDIQAHMPNKSNTEAYAVLLSDLHVGSKYFMESEFEEFVMWLSEPDAIARKIRFLLLCGDVVDGVGIYPNQDKELVLATIEEQLGRLYELLSKVPDYIKIVISPGNHDPGRRALPQPAIPEKYCQGLWNHNNITMVGNPAIISLNGVKVLMFHGQSIDDIVRVIPGLSYDEPGDVMKCLLRARHVSPIYGSKTPIAPELEDWMVIGDNIDIFHAGHVHRWVVDRYKGTLIVNSSTWQRQTQFQTSVGITPTPGIATIINLKTMEVHQKNYS